LERFSDRDKGNAFVADGGSPSNPGVSARWVGRRELEISYDRSLRVFKSEPRVGDITIKYVQQ